MRIKIFQFIILAVIISVSSGCVKKSAVNNDDYDSETEKNNSTSSADNQTPATTTEEKLHIWPEQKWTQNDYEGWKTYINEKLGYRIKFPADWSYVDYGELGYSAAQEVVINPPDAEDFVSYISISLYNNYNISEIRNGFLDPKTYGKPFQENEVLLNDAYQTYHFFNGENENVEYLIIPHNNKIYSLSTQKNNFPKIFQILASFEFLE